MQEFEFQTVPAMKIAWGGSKRLGNVIAARFKPRNALFITDAGLVKAGLVAPIISNLVGAGFAVTVFDKVIADPPENVVYDCVEAGRQARADIIVGCGGGSSLDVAKLVAVLLSSNQPLADMYGIDQVKGARLPLILLPTTAGTGSEVTNISIITTTEFTKMGVVSPQLYADFVMLDAELTVMLPRIHTAASGIDAMVHAIEAYTSKHKKNAFSDALAREALKLLGGNLIAACNEPSNRTARENMLLGATLAGQSFANSPVAAVHALAYPLGARYHIPHGLSNALMLGPVLRFNAKEVALLYSELADVLHLGGQGNSMSRANAFVDHMKMLLIESGAPRRLRDVGVTEECLSTLAAAAMRQNRLLANNPVEVSEEDALALYREAF
ncbi:iron-containing alcohol dehydrogenase [Sinorhizobium saheli]|uniref:Alcohol dehydrogenase 2 n=1 Tax=Sinorhizobium saheli TaxID=36856 RepID=A0A178YTA0_SINSA|nr:iron-containing alcohol dehydrogenase [Sinorhizobium saheli]MQW90031.1 iron-containing alcohol dehydrogenase [Sinorhizobium saheli]OAP50416.1 alcohol dehydrogenase [Sinorhizobium saheli]